jgi:hypothetical protein
MAAIDVAGPIIEAMYSAQLDLSKVEESRRVIYGIILVFTGIAIHYFFPSAGAHWSIGLAVVAMGIALALSRFAEEMVHTSTVSRLDRELGMLRFAFLSAGGSKDLFDEFRKTVTLLDGVPTAKWPDEESWRRWRDDLELSLLRRVSP